MMLANETKKILIIEDEITQRILAKEFLETAGYSVRLSDDGRHGLNMAKLTKPDLIILDLMLPTLDGYSLCKHLKQSSETSQIPIILVTASKEPDVIKRGLSAGADDFVTKPVDWQFLADRVEFVMSQAHQKKSVGNHVATQNTNQTVIGKKEKEEIVRIIQSIQKTMEKTNASVTKSEELHSIELQLLQQKAKSNVEEVCITASEKYDHAQELHTQETNRLIANYEEEMSKQRRLHDEQLIKIQEQKDFEPTSPNGGTHEGRGASSTALDEQISPNTHELSEPVRAMWHIVHNSCDSFDNTLSVIQESMASGTQGNDILAKQAEKLSRSIGQLKKLATVLNEPRSASSVFEVNEFISKIADSLKRVAANKSVKVNTDFLPISSQVCADQSRISYAMSLIAIRAIRSTPQSGEITLSTSTNDDGSLRFSISDNGKSMSPGQVNGWINCLDKVGPMPANKNIDNVINIPMIAALVRQQGGSLEIDSQPGQGNTISIILPPNSEHEDFQRASDAGPNEKIAC